MNNEESLAEVTLSLPLPGSFHYRIPPALKEEIEIGKPVLVPLGKRKVKGWVLNFVPEKEEEREIKEILEILPLEPTLSREMLEFFKWTSEYYFSPLGEIIKAALPKPKRQLKGQEGRGQPPSKIGESIPPLKREEERIFLEIKRGIVSRKYTPYLLHGSDRMGVYLHAIFEVIKSGRKVMALVPEIPLISKWISLLDHFFGEDLAFWHSGLSPGKRYREWQRIREKGGRFVIGTRSAIFAPLENLGLIIVDQEHETSYKEEGKLHYNSRDLSLVRGKLANAVVILGSATPSLESYHNCQIKKLIYLPLKRDTPLPEIEIVDMKEEEKIFSSRLKEAIAESLKMGGRVLLFLDRRGFATAIFCKGCGFAFKCPNCSLFLIVHSKEKGLFCHYCNYTTPLPLSCPSCNSLRLKPLGLGTERLEREVRRLFPSEGVVRVDRDTFPGKKGRRDLKRVLEEEGRILLGTQMITKGEVLPPISLI